MKKTAMITAGGASTLAAGITALVAADQALKWLAGKYLIKTYVISSWLNFGYRENTGIAWSIQLPYPLLLALNFGLVAIFVHVALKYFDMDRWAARIAVVLVLAGGCGNIIDRLAKGYVVDFISVWIWPVFNLADIFLTVGIFLILLFYAKIKRN
jgi:signal peptidase II